MSAQRSVPRILTKDRRLETVRAWPLHKGRITELQRWEVNGEPVGEWKKEHIAPTRLYMGGALRPMQGYWLYGPRWLVLRRLEGLARIEDKARGEKEKVDDSIPAPRPSMAARRFRPPPTHDDGPR